MASCFSTLLLNWFRPGTFALSGQALGCLQEGLWGMWVGLIWMGKGRSFQRDPPKPHCPSCPPATSDAQALLANGLACRPLKITPSHATAGVYSRAVTLGQQGPSVPGWREGGSLWEALSEWKSLLPVNTPPWCWGEVELASLSSGSCSAIWVACNLRDL